MLYEVITGMGAIKGAGDVAIKSILNARNDGPFVDLADFISRIDGSKVNKRVIESLTKAGAFDSFGYSRRRITSYNVCYTKLLRFYFIFGKVY